MPNYVTNRVKFEGSANEIKELMEKIKNDTFGVGTIDFMKVIPRPQELDIEAGSSTYRGLKFWKEFIDGYKEANNISNNEIVSPDDISENFIKEHLKNNPDIDAGDWELGRKGTINMIKYGAPTWYEWNLKTYNTKWNACGYEDSGDYRYLANSGRLIFDTAWSNPYPIFVAISKMYPEVKIIHDYADEDIGFNCGTIEYYGGEIIDEYYPEEGKEAYDFATRIVYG